MVMDLSLSTKKFLVKFKDFLFILLNIKYIYPKIDILVSLISKALIILGTLGINILE